MIPVLQDTYFNGFFITIRDITELETYQQKLVYIATIDALTGAFNRRHFYELTEERLANIDAKHESVLAIIDIDNLKSFNDNYGHDLGDKVLISLTEYAKSYFEGKGIFARLGGEEFVIFLPEYTSESFDIIDTFREGVKAISIEYKGEELHLTISVGITVVNIGDKFADRLKVADESLYEAKKTGKNRCVFTERSLNK